MISIVVVYNSKRLFQNILLNSLEKQSAEYELIAIDNSKGEYKSAAEALNCKGKQATGKYIMFVHQDVELPDNSWLEKIEASLDNIPDLGIAGVTGMSVTGKNNEERKRGRISDCGRILQGQNVTLKVEQVQTLDECLFVVPKPIFDKLQLDWQTFDGWHCYCIDYCLSVRQLGKKAYVIPMFIYHRSLRSNASRLLIYQERVLKKHKANFKHIYTTCGEVSLPKCILRRVHYFLKRVLLYEKLFPSWIESLKKECRNCETILDLGCGYNSPIQYCSVPFSVGVELFEPYFEESRKKGIHNEYINTDIRKVDFEPKSFDAVLCSEVLEHLTKADAEELIGKMEKWAKKKVIITTPNGHHPQDHLDGNALQEHISHWTVGDFKKLGFNVFGMNGWKKLRGDDGLIKYRPKFLWQMLCRLSQKIIHLCPKHAFQLFAVKSQK